MALTYPKLRDKSLAKRLLRMPYQNIFSPPTLLCDFSVAKFGNYHIQIMKKSFIANPVKLIHKFNNPTERNIIFDKLTKTKKQMAASRMASVQIQKV